MSNTKLPPWLVVTFKPTGFNKQIIAVLPAIQSDKIKGRYKVLSTGTYEDCTVYAMIYPLVTTVETHEIASSKVILLPEQFNALWKN